MSINVYYFLVALTIIICVFLAVIVLIQNPKGGGLDSNFGGMSNNTFGAQRTTDFLEKGTWYLAISLLVISLLSALVIQNVQGSNGSSGVKNVQPSSLPVENTDGLINQMDNTNDADTESLDPTKNTNQEDTPDQE